MNALEQVFAKKKAFVGFVMGGDGGVDYCLRCCLKLLEGGVDVLEIGFPFSDPIADGPVIQKAAERALKQGTNAASLLEIARGIREKSKAPLVLFSYYNPLLQQGQRYLQDLKEAGFDAVLALDLPAPEKIKGHPYFDGLQQAGLAPIFVLAPSTEEERRAKIASFSQGFLYYACQKGTTGMRKTLPEDVAEQVAQIQQNTNTPVVVGFGIGDAKSAAAALESADGFVVGSAFVQKMEERVDPIELKKLAQELDPRKKDEQI